jgi:hypothetical protein
MLAGAATSGGRLARGALTGLIVQLAALAAFYLANAFVLDLGHHSVGQDIGLTLSVGNFWLRAGLLSGPILGLFGAWAGRRGGMTVAAAAATTAILEPAAVYLAYLGSNGAFAAGDGNWNGIYAAEAGMGLASALILWRIRRAKSSFLAATKPEGSGD